MALYVAVDCQRQCAKGVHLRMYVPTYVYRRHVRNISPCNGSSLQVRTLEKEMRNAIDEVCRKTKLPAVGGVENDFLT